MLWVGNFVASSLWATKSLILLIFLYHLYRPTVIFGSKMELTHMDVIESLQLWNTSYAGLTIIRGMRPISPAIFLQGPSRNVKTAHHAQAVAVGIMSGSKDFTIMASVQQEEENSGTILSLMKGQQRYFELQSSGRKDEIRLHYIHSGSIHIEAFPYRLADQLWHRVAVVVSGSQLELWIDCKRVYRRVVPSLDNIFPPVDNILHKFKPKNDVLENFSYKNTDSNQPMVLYLGQRNPTHFLFKGALQDVKIAVGPGGHLMQCPNAESVCPTCGSFQQYAETVESLQSMITQLTQRLDVAESRISTLQECKCQKSCYVNNSIKSDGSSWKNGCEICSCQKGDILCNPISCPLSSMCKNPVYNEGECCPLCLKKCSLKGMMYDHGESVSPRKCVECECKNGKMQCLTINPAISCPKLSCPEKDQFEVAGECCKMCPGRDFCLQHNDCHLNATCINLQTTYTCHCNKGFTGDGKTCYDINECEVIGAHHGHYCQSDTTCVNTIGSYECECLDGFIRRDHYTCERQDQCKSGDRQCHQFAECVGTSNGSKCRCNKGYTGDGVNCAAVCNEACLNGGICTAGDVCSCRLGYTGNRCQLDVDECSLGLHQCEKKSSCVNLPGWYTCKCFEGFSLIASPTNTSAHCQDIDECKLDTHTCYKRTDCINTEGSFECLCTNSTQCSNNCIIDGKERANGEIWTSMHSQCSKCICKDGKVTCDQYICDCSSLHKDSPCCPHCNPKLSCAHQTESQIVFQSRQKWIFECQTCECLNGEIDCWSMECPPITCSNPFTDENDCCPRCPDDPCSVGRQQRQSTNNNTQMDDHNNPQPCHFTDSFSNSVYWAELISQCHNCKCQAPYCSDYRSDSGTNKIHRINGRVIILIAAIYTFIFNEIIFSQTTYANCTIVTPLLFLCFLLSYGKMITNSKYLL